MKTPIVTQAEQIARLRASLLTYKSRCASLERKCTRLEADHPCVEHEREIAKLEERCTDLLRVCELAELEVLQLRRQIRSVA